MIKIIMSHTLKNKERMQSIFIEAILEENEYCKKNNKNHFNKNLVISVDFNQVIKAGYVINYFLQKVIK